MALQTSVKSRKKRPSAKRRAIFVIAAAALVAIAVIVTCCIISAKKKEAQRIAEEQHREELAKISTKHITVAGASLELKNYLVRSSEAASLLVDYMKEKEFILDEGEVFFGEVVTYESEKIGYCAAPSSLNLRAEATTDSDIRYIFRRGDELTIIGEKLATTIRNGEKEEYTWYLIQASDVTGYVRSDYVLFGEEGEKLYADTHLDEVGKLPTKLSLSDIGGLSEDLQKQFKKLGDEISYCLNLYQQTAESKNNLTMYSILSYWAGIYANALTLAQNCNVETTFNEVAKGNALVLAECTRIQTLTGMNHEQLTQAIVEQSEAYKKKKAAEEAAKVAAAQRQAAEQAAQAAKALAPDVLKSAVYAGAMEGIGTTGRKMANYASTFVGTLPYILGGASLTRGADCSGFLGQILAKYGYLDQEKANKHGYYSYHYPGLGTKVCGAAAGMTDEQFYSLLKPGDIVCYSGHVMMYFGNKLIVHEPDKGRKAEFGYFDKNRVIAVVRFAK